MIHKLLDKVLLKADQEQATTPRYHVFRKPDGRIIRVDIQKARAAMRHAMTLRAELRRLYPYDQF